MITQQEINDVLGATAYSAQGEKIGKVGDIYFDDRTGEPAWLTVNTGMFGTKETFIPTQARTHRGEGEVEIAYDKALVKDAPRMDVAGGDHISEEQEAELYRYYGLGPEPTTDQAGIPHQGSRPDGADAMTRSEEQLRIGTEQVQTGHVRLRRYVVTEDVQTSVPVSHEEVRVEREPIAGTNREAAMGGPAFSDGEHEMTLHAEHAVVHKQAEPVERVRLTSDTVREDEPIYEQVRKERIDIEDDAGEGRWEQRPPR